MEVQKIVTPEFNKVWTFVGSRGTGKTPVLRGDDSLGIVGFIRPKLEQGMKVLIVDTLDHASYRDIPVIQPEQLAGWKKGVYRICIDPDDMPKFKVYINKLDSMYNTMIVFEDAHKHEEFKLTKPARRLIIDSKQKNIDIVWMYHAWGWTPIDLLRISDKLEIFKTKDSVECRKKYLPNYIETLAAFTAVKEHPSRFHHLTVDNF